MTGRAGAAMLGRGPVPAATLRWGCGGCRSEGPVPAALTEAASEATSPAPAGSGPAAADGDGASRRVGLRRDRPGHDRFSGGELSRDDLGEPAVGDPGLDRNRRGLLLARHKLVDRLRGSRSASAAPSAPTPSNASASSRAPSTSAAAASGGARLIHLPGDGGRPSAGSEARRALLG